MFNKLRGWVSVMGLLTAIITADVKSVNDFMWVGMVCFLQIFIPAYDRNLNFGKGAWVMHPFFNKYKKED